MTRIDIDVEVDEKSLQRTLKALEHKLERGAEKGLDDALNVGKTAAKKKIDANRTPFTAPHLSNESSFRTVIQSQGDDNIYGIIRNTRDYAAYVDKGVSGTQNQRDTPFSYTDDKPPLDKLIPWVKDRLGGWDIDTDPTFGSPDFGNNPYAEGGGREKLPFEEQLGKKNLNIISNAPEDKDLVSEYDHRYTKNINLRKKDNVSENDELVVTNDSGRLSSLIVQDVTNDYVEFSRDRRYYFDPDEAPDVDTIDILTPIGKKNIRSLDEVEVDDYVLVDAESAFNSPDSWGEEYVLARVDAVNNNSVTLHDISGGHTDVIIQWKNIYTTEDDQDAIWKLKNRSESELKGSKITYYTRGEKETGYIKSVERGDKQYHIDSTVDIVKSPESGYGNEILDEVETVVDIDTSEDFFSTFEDAPSFDTSDSELLTDVPTDFSNTEEGTRFLAWSHKEGELVDTFFVRTDAVDSEEALLTSSSTSVLGDFSTNTAKDYQVTLLGQYPDIEGGYSNFSATDSDGNNLLWYGQEINYEYDGVEYSGVVSGWDTDTIYLDDDTTLDSIPRYPSYLKDGKLTNGQAWSELSSDERKTQIENEIKYRVEKSVEDEVFVDEFVNWVGDTWFERFKDEEKAHQTISNMTIFTDQTGLGVAGKVSTLGGLTESEYTFQLSPGSDSTDLPEDTAFHELFHAVMTTKNLSSSNDLVDGFMFSKSGSYPGEYPLTAFNADGSKDSTLFNELQNKTSDDLPDHGDLSDILYSTDDGTIGSDRFDDVSVGQEYEQIQTTDVTESQWDTDETVDTLFDPKPSAISSGDLVRMKNTNDGEIKKSVFKGTGDELESGNYEWKFASPEGSDFRIEIKENGDLDGPWELTGLYSPDRPDGWWETETNWSPSQNDPLLNLSEAANRALKRQLKVYTDDWLDGEEHSFRSYKYGIKRGYASSNGDEITSGLIEIMEAQDVPKALEAQKVYETHPELVKAFLNVMEPSPLVRDYLSDYDELDL